MMAGKYIPLFYWSEIKFIHKEMENYGDLLSKYITEKVSGKEIKWVHPKKQSWYKLNKINYLTIGSIIHHVTKDSIVWGSGIIDRKQNVLNADFRAVRGPETRKFLLEKGYQCPEEFGDPALLLPKYYNPHVEKSFELGVIPHYHDYKKAKEIFNSIPGTLVIDLMTLDVEQVTNQILKCKKTISSSLHGLIVSQAYNIPSIWVEFSKKLFGDGIKFLDYFLSVELEPYSPPFFNTFSQGDINEWFSRFPNLPREEVIKRLQNGLIRSCPFIQE